MACKIPKKIKDQKRNACHSAKVKIALDKRLFVLLVIEEIKAPYNDKADNPHKKRNPNTRNI